MTSLQTQTVPVCEQFGPTLQGEGPAAGQVAQFLRTGGCDLSCAWCFDPATLVLMADWSEKRISDIREGDLVMSYRDRRYETARVMKTMVRYVNDRVTVIAGDSQVICTPDHVFANPHHVDGRRRSRADALEGRHVRVVRSQGWGPDIDVRTEDWWTGWAQGLILGDGHIGYGKYPKAWLRVCDKEIADAYAALVVRRGGGKTSVCEQRRRTTSGKRVWSVAHVLNKFPEAAGLPDDPDEIAGFLAGFFDAEGSVGRNQIDMSQKDDKTLDRVAGMVNFLGIPYTLKYSTGGKSVGQITINGAAYVDAFFRLTRPVLERKSRKRQRIANRMLTPVAVEAVKPSPGGEVVNLTTSTGFFFAAGMLVEQCDSAFTWDGARYNLREEITPTDPEAVVAALIPGVTLVLSGGEPLLHQHNDALLYVLDRAKRLDCDVHVETNGTLAPGDRLAALVDRFVVSPKLAHAGAHRGGQDPALDPVWPQIARAVPATTLKVVVRGAQDVTVVAHWARELGWPRSQVWVMPLGTTREQLNTVWPEVASAAAVHRFNASHRLHILAWGDTRGT